MDYREMMQRVARIEGRRTPILPVPGHLGIGQSSARAHLRRHGHPVRFQRRHSGTVLAPLVTHLVWSTLMVSLLPRMSIVE
jgi:hypothetical protein